MKTTTSDIAKGKTLAVDALSERNFRPVLRAVMAMFMAIMSAALLTSCMDDLDMPDGYCPEGEPTRVTVAVDLDDATALTRADMQEGLDKRVNELYVAIYNVATGARTGTYTFERSDDNTDHGRKELTIDALSGRSYIVAVANYSLRYGASSDTGKYAPLGELLDAADTWDKYKAISVAFNSDGSVSMDAPLNPLVMSGTYTEENHTDGSRVEDGIVALSPGMAKPAGAIHLRRMISQVKFNVEYNKENISEFNIKSWQVFNVPNQSWLHERADDAPNVNVCDLRRNGGDPFVDGEVMHDVRHSDNIYTFDYWQLENRRTGIVPKKVPELAYAYREMQHKNADGTNSGKFSALVPSATSTDPNNNATYVVINVEMLMNVDENGNKLSQSEVKRRRVDTKYYVHLGYIEGVGPNKLIDFNCRRNGLYTYNVTINNVGDLIVEAKNDNERNPAVEGIVSDVLDTNYSVDAHYSAVNVMFTKSELENFEYLVMAYDLNGREVIIDSKDYPNGVPDNLQMYMKWIELRKTTGSTVLASYKPRSGANSDGRTYLLSDLQRLGSTLEEGWYTMFIDEYTYETATNGNESGSTNWHGYVNRPNRNAWLYVLTEVSPDKASLYYRSKYAVTQKSIQTYYNNLSSSGLGVEHINESFGLNLRNTYNSSGNGNNQSGRYNLAYYLAGNTSWSSNSFTWVDDKYDWSTYLNLNTFQSINAINNQGITRAATTHYLPEIKRMSTQTSSEYDPDLSSRNTNRKYIQAITACLNRNRDLDGDGKIDASEIRWFIPVNSQYVRLILGRQSLVTPIIDVEVTTKLAYTDNSKNSSMLFYTSDGRQIWAMEGTSDSGWMQYGGGAPWEVRCVRNLGGDMSKINTSNVTQMAYVQRAGTRIVDMLYYDSKSIRAEAFYSSDSPMPVHHIYDQRYNRCYKSFEVAEAQYDIPGSDMTDLNVYSYDWAEYLSTHNPCKSLVQKTGKNGWRVPNQKELTIMCRLGLNPTSYVYNFSCSVSYYDKEGYAYGHNPNDMPGSFDVKHRYVMKSTGSGMATQGGDGTTSFVVRCVRDYVE